MAESLLILWTPESGPELKTVVTGRKDSYDSLFPVHIMVGELFQDET